MNWLLASIGILLIGSGIIIWRYNLVDWLSNVPRGPKILDRKKAAKLGGSYLSFVGACFIAFGYAIENMSDKTVVLIVVCFIPVNMVVLVTYLVAQSRNVQ